MKNKLIIAALALTAGAYFASAQNPPTPGEGRPPRVFGGPLMEALDANKNGEIDATEIANATAALKTLDKNGDGKLTMDELRPTRPGGPGGGRGPGERGERGERGDGPRPPGGIRPQGQ